MIRHVEQLHGNGCFVACIAMLSGTSYEEAYRRIFPGKYMPHPSDYWEMQGLTPEESIALMPRLGFEVKQSKLTRVQSLKKRTALVLLRWQFEPTRLHGLVFDGETGMFVDPCYENPLSHRQLNKHLEAIYYVKKVSNELPIRSGDTDPSGLSQPGSDGGGTASTGNTNQWYTNCSWSYYGNW